MNQVLQQPLPLASENPFSSEQECIENAHHSFSAAPPDPLRRDSVYGHSNPRILNSLPPSNSTPRYSGPRPDAPYQLGTSLSDTGSGSISASPISSTSSSFVFGAFTPTATSVYSSHIPGANTFQPSFPYNYSGAMSSIRRNSSITDASSNNMLPPNHPVSPSLGTSARDNYTTSTPGLLRHPHTLSPRHSEISRYSSLPDTPRSAALLPTTMALPAATGYSSSGVPTYQGSQQHPETPPFHPQETYYEITCEGTTVVPNIEAKIDKGFFLSNDRVWTCYRRNYFAVTVSYGLSPWVPNGRLYLNRNGKQEQIQAMAVSLAAAIDGSGGKPIELIQHTPKRDKGPQLQIKKELLPPTPPGKSHEHNYSLNFHQPTQIVGPQLPLQNETENSHSYGSSSHPNSNYQQAFERIQFKYATANNGKRRAQQQYYHLIVELWANVQNPRDSEPDWIKIAARSSSHVVVRGRSPSHYQNEGPHNSSASRGGGSTGLGGPGHGSLGSNGGGGYGGSYSRLGMNGPSPMGGSAYRGNTYSLDPSPVGSHSVSSASSLSGGPVEGLVDQHMVDDEDRKALSAQEGYQYYPQTIYESIPAKIEAPGLPIPERRIKEEYPGPAGLASGWTGGGCGRFQGMETSRGLYPDMQAHLGY